MKLHIWPMFRGEDDGDGGVRRVIEAQARHLARHGVVLVDDPAQADVLACHITVPETYVKQFPDKPIVAHCHGLYWAEYEWPTWALKANGEVMELLRVADAVTAPSEWVAQAIRRHTARPVTVVPHGVEVSEWEPVPSAGYVLWNKTRVDPVCDPEAANVLARMMPDVRFVTTFGRPEANVTVTDRLSYDDGKRVLAEAGVYLCTARETFGIGTLEAMACGVPVVGWAWGGQVDIIEHGVSGWLAQPGDYEGLAEGVRWAFANRQDIATVARATVLARFGWPEAMERYVEVYQGALERRERAGPKVSVIVRAYGLAGYLPACLDSVAKQSLKDWECIIVDDASPDACGVIGERYAAADPRFRVIHNERNQYLAATYNTGIGASTAPYILPLDADDMLAPNTLSVLSQVLDSERGLHIAYGNVRFVGEDGETPVDFGGNGRGPGHSGWPVDYRHDWMMRGPGQLLPYCSMFRREVWEATGGYRERCQSSEEQDFWLRATSYGFRPKMVTMADTLIYRQIDDSITHVHGLRNHRAWFLGSRNLEASPAGAVTVHQLPVPSLDPPAVSVVIPLGPGHERTVLDAIDSVDAQTFRQWECIVVNDTGAPLETRLPSWVRLVDSDGGHSVAHARNLGIASAKAPLFVPLDADDYLQPEYLEAVLWAYRESGGDMIYSDYWEDPEVEGDFRLFKTPDSDPRQVLFGSLPVTMLLTKKAWGELGGFDESLPSWEDWDFQIACHASGLCFRRLAYPLWTYRKHTGRRRNDNAADFDTGKEAMLGKWGDYWQGGKTLMGCSSCGKKKTLAPKPPKPKVGSVIADDAVLMEYTGGKLGTMTFRGASGTVYRFGAGEPPKYVLAQDASALEARTDFRRANGVEPVMADAPEGPALIAERPHDREAVTVA